MTSTIRRADVDVDPTRLLDAVRAKLSSAEGPAAAMLETYLGHLEAEFRGDVDSAMHTLVADPRFRFWCGFRNPDAPLVLSRPQIRENYERAFASGFPPVHIDVKRFVAADDGLVLEGEQHAIVPGRQLSPLGFDVNSDADHYCVTRFALLIEFRDGAMVGEDHYWPLPHTVFEITDAEP